MARLGLPTGKGRNFSRQNGNIGTVRQSQSFGRLGDRLVLVARLAKEQIDPGWILNRSRLVLCKTETLRQLPPAGRKFRARSAAGHALAPTPPYSLTPIATREQASP